MEGDNHPQKRALREARDRAIETLVASFSTDELGLDAFEARVNSAYEATSAEALNALIADLTVANVPRDAIRVRVPEANVTTASSAALAPVGTKNYFARAIFANVERRGTFSVQSESHASSVFGNLLLDFRNAIFPNGVTRIHVRAVFGNVEILVPADLRVECEGTGILGNVENTTRTPAEQSPDAPILQIVGTAVFGNIELHAKLPAHLQRLVEELRARTPKR